MPNSSILGQLPVGLEYIDDLGSMLDRVDEQVLIKDEQDNVLRASRAVAQSLRATPEEMAVTPSARWWPDMAERYHQDDLYVLRSGLPKLGIVEPITDASGDTRLIYTDKLPLRDEHGATCAVVAILRDLTDVCASRSETLRGVAGSGTGALARGVASDVENLMSGVSGYCDLLALDVAEGRDITSYLDAIFQAVDEGTQLAKKLRAIGAHSEEQLRIVDVNETLVDHWEALLIGRPGNTEVRPDLSSERLSVEIGPSSLARATKLLIENSFLASANVVNVQTRKFTRDGRDFAVVTVSDDGEGVPGSLRSRLFEPYLTTRQVRPPGTGLGLTEVRNIVERVNGALWFRPSPSGGAAFSFRLPMVGNA